MKFLLNIFRLFPKSFRRNFKNSLARTVNDEQAKSMPRERTFLESMHIQNCKMLANRIEMLKLMPQNAIVAEIGVYAGDYSSEIINAAQPKKLFLIDIWDNDSRHLMQSVENKFATEIKSDQVKLIQKDSVTALEEFDDNFFDWVYIDSDHSYQHTKKELAVLSKKVKKDGYICGHDYTMGLWLMWDRYGVIEAVNEFCVQNSYEMAYFALAPGMFYSYALKKI